MSSGINPSVAAHREQDAYRQGVQDGRMGGMQGLMGLMRMFGGMSGMGGAMAFGMMSNMMSSQGCGFGHRRW
ncbi:hypothetical protein [Roseateles sp. YR242]|uniref:hypothetical protein n=1 Tax=Roseateles sp. YR242 TaxID=1855305 RepID=UPI000B85A11B|nr:hypothetical protein [Roseateles sp. YR242]